MAWNSFSSMASNSCNTDSMFSLIQQRQRKPLTTTKLFRAATGNQHFVQRLKLDRKLDVHDGCVNTVCWNEKGSVLLSGSDDQHLVISNPFNGKILAKIRSGHRSNIFSAKFLPASMDRELVSCSGSGEIFYTDVDREDTYGTNRFDCHFGTTYKIVVVPNEAATFLSCGDDGTVRFFDLRVKTSCSKFNCEEDVVINLRDAVSAMAVDPIIPFQMAVGSADGIVRIYDRRMLKTKESGGSSQSLISRFQSPSCAAEKRHYRITSLNYRPGSHDVLVNYSSENIYLFNTYTMDTTQTYSTQPLTMGETSKTVNEINATRMSGGSNDPEPSTSGAAAAASDNGHDVSGVYKPIKRLRLRGDWSDTGPDARPESEDPAPTNMIMQRMSDLLTRMLNSHGGGRIEESENDANAPDLLPSESTARETVPPAPQASSSDTTTAAGLLRSVMLTSTGNGARIQPSMRRETTESERYSISSEGLVSPELSSQDYDSADMTVGQNQALSREKPEGLSPTNPGVDNGSAFASGSCVGGDAKKDNSECVIHKAPSSKWEHSAEKDSELACSAETSVCAPFVFEPSEQSASSVASENVYSVTCDIETHTGHISSHEKRTEELTAGEGFTKSSPKVEDEYRMNISTRETHPEQISPMQIAECESLRHSSQSENHITSVLCSVSPMESSPSSIDKEPASDLCSDQDPPLTNPKDVSKISEIADAEDSSGQSIPCKSFSEPTSVCDKSPECATMTNENIVDDAKSPTLMQADKGNSQCSKSQLPLSFSHSQTPENSSKSSQSSNTTVAIAEEDLSDYDNTLSQKTFDDMSAVTSLGPSLSLSERLSETMLRETGNSENVSLASSSNSPSFKDTHFSDDLTFESDSLQGQEIKVSSSSVDIGRRQIELSVVEESVSEDKSQDDNIKSDANMQEVSNDQSVQESSETTAACGGWPDNSQAGALMAESKVESQTNDVSVTFNLADPISSTPSGKGKGVGKSSSGKNKDSSQQQQQQPSRIYSPYNSGSMKFSTADDHVDIHMISEPSVECAAGSASLQGGGSEGNTKGLESSTKPQIHLTQQAHSLPTKLVSQEIPQPHQQTDSELTPLGNQCVEIGPRSSEEGERPFPSRQGPEESARQRRTGYSLPPTGSFQLYSDEEDEEDDDDAEEKERTRRGSSDSDRMGRAASKIQELFRKKREASEAAKLKNLPQPRVLMKFAGHRNCRTMIKEANFYGDDYVMSGSDCGRILIWERLTGHLVMYLEADRHVVNCVQPNPVFPLIASSGIDYDVKVWAPLEEDCQFDEDVAEMIIRRNELMLVETRDTITVPAAFMLRVLASLSQIRTGRNSSASQGQSSQEHSSQD